MKIRKDFIELDVKQIKNPKNVRYSWGNTSTSNIFNDAGLPASSFLEEAK